MRVGPIAARLCLFATAARTTTKGSVATAVAGAFFLAPSRFSNTSYSTRSSGSSRSSSSSTFSTARFMSSDEVVKAREAAAAVAAASNQKSSATTNTDSMTEGAMAVDGGPPTVFDKLLSGEWPCDKVYEDELVLAFRDITPQGPIHVLVIPKHRNGLTQISKAREADHKEMLGHLLFIASQVGKQECPQGFRIVINDGEHGAQSVYHLHIHVIGGRQMNWPPG